MIKLFKFEEVCEVLIEIGVCGFMVIEIKGFGVQFGYIEIYCGVEYIVNFVLKVKLELVVVVFMVDQVVEIIFNIVCIGKIGDGKIFVLDVVQVVCVWIGEINEDVL